MSYIRVIEGLCRDCLGFGVLVKACSLIQGFRVRSKGSKV